MGANDHIFDDNEYRGRVVCNCGAIYEISESDGVPGCRDIESVCCDFCGKELARHYGNCDGRLVDDSTVDARLKQARLDKDAAFDAYVAEHGYRYGTPEYREILDAWQSVVDECLSDLGIREEV